MADGALRVFLTHGRCGVSRSWRNGREIAASATIVLLLLACGADQRSAATITPVSGAGANQGDAKQASPTDSEEDAEAGDVAGARFQDEALSDGEVTFDEYEAAIHAAADCVRAKGFAVTVPGEGRAVIDPAVDPDKLLSFDVHIEDRGVSTGDLVLTCQERWSLRVEQAWMEQLLPSDEVRERAMQAAWECGASRGQQQEPTPSIQDAYQAVLEFDCRPWESIG